MSTDRRPPEGESADVPVLRPVRASRSPLDVPGVDTGLTADEIVAAVRESRERPTATERETVEMAPDLVALRAELQSGVEALPSLELRRLD